MINFAIGLRMGTLFSAFLMAVGTAIRCISTRSDLIVKKTFNDINSILNIMFIFISVKLSLRGWLT